MSWVKTIFEKNYAPYLDVNKRNKRQEGFRIIFSELEKMNLDFYRIIETGTTRKSPDNPYAWKDGMGTLMFESFVNYTGGIVDTVDIDSTACELCKKLVGNSVNVHCEDSVTFLSNAIKNAQFYYLDSWDVDRVNPLPSQEHHLKEFKAIEISLKNCIVAIDDNFMHGKINVGKGKLVKDYLANKGIYPIYDAYQIIYKF
jgi:hypothetical protein